MQRIFEEDWFIAVERERRERELERARGFIGFIRGVASVYFAGFWLLYMPSMIGLWMLGLPDAIDVSLPVLLWFVAVFVASDGSEPWLDGRFD